MLTVEEEDLNELCRVLDKTAHSMRAPSGLRVLPAMGDPGAIKAVVMGALTIIAGSPVGLSNSVYLDGFSPFGTR
jgi:hypothetical protein